jgi:Flp pilus assembly protein TadD
MELGLLRQWVEDGMPEGIAADQTAPTLLPDGWQLGKPDLVLELPEPYKLPAEGVDVYRNFVIPVPLDRRRFVRALEFRPRTRVIHHAFFIFDRTRQSRHLDERDPGPGFAGASLPPNLDWSNGYFLSWQPGRRPVESLPGMAWSLTPGSDLILQIHMQPSGKVEEIHPMVGLYFTEQSPTNSPLKISLSSYAIDIPAGTNQFEIRDRFVLPADAFLLGLLPHAHFLAREVEGWARFPDGRVQSLLRIPDWDFNWQTDYRLVAPLFLPRGTELSMRILYDNSAENVRNPNQPPIRVRYGAGSSDEMGELWLQLLLRSPEDADAVRIAYGSRLLKDAVDYNSLLIERTPTNAHAHVQLGKARYAFGDTNAALALISRAAELDPQDEEAHYNLGVMLQERADLSGAAAAFEKALRINPSNVRALNNLGLLLLRTGRLQQARPLFERALNVDPDDSFVRENLELLHRIEASPRRRNGPGNR